MPSLDGDRRDHRNVVGTYRCKPERWRGRAGLLFGHRVRSFTPAGGRLEDSIELGRACIAKAYRNSQVLFLLWKGLALYIAFNRKRFLFGCCR